MNLDLLAQSKRLYALFLLSLPLLALLVLQSVNPTAVKGVVATKMKLNK